jgi:glutamyl-tRNA synthetase
MFQLLRVAVTGQLVSPPLFESIKILGEEKTLERIKKALEFVINPPAEPKY